MIKKICIIGYGSHVKKTIIPALNLSKDNLKIITSKSDLVGFQTFPDIKAALTKITKDYVIYNATPPNLHFKTSKLILNKGFNLIVEKPVCLNVYQYNILKKIADKNKLFIFENMMYFYSKQFFLFKKYIKIKKIKSFEINFSIPNFDKNSFRNNFDSNLLLLYDVLCYPMSLISYLNYKVNTFDISFKYKTKFVNMIIIKFKSNNINFFIKSSFFNKYKNFVKINYHDGSSVKQNYFFYGKKQKKENTFKSSSGKTKSFIFNDYNVFNKIFSFSIKQLYKYYKINSSICEDYLKILNRVKKKLKNCSN